MKWQFLIKIFKIVLLYSTILYTLLLICSVESLTEQGYLTIAVIIAIGLGFFSYKVISKEDLKSLTLDKYINKLLQKLS
jgi:uncharacterized membrane protein YiaA